MSEAPSLVTRAEYARMRGVSRKTVTKWVDSGRVPLTIAEGRELIDPARAAASLMGSEQRAREVDDLLARETEDEPEIARGPSLTELKSQQVLEQIQILRMQRMEREGQLVSRVQVQLEQETAARIVRSALDGLPQRAEELLAAGKAGGTLGLRKALREMVRQLEDGMAVALVEAADRIEAQRQLQEEDDAA